MSNRPHTAYWPGSQVCMVEACMSGRQHTLMLERCTVMVAQVGVVAPEAAQHNLSQGAVRTAPSCCKATRYGTSTVRCRRRCRRVCSSCIVRTPPAGRAAAAAGAAAAGGGRALGKVVQGFDCCRWQCSPGGPGRRAARRAAAAAAAVDATLLRHASMHRTLLQPRVAAQAARLHGMHCCSQPRVAAGEARGIQTAGSRSGIAAGSFGQKLHIKLHTGVKASVNHACQTETDDHKLGANAASK
jgi:hypothetical protein